MLFIIVITYNLESSSQFFPNCRLEAYFNDIDPKNDFLSKQIFQRKTNK